MPLYGIVGLNVLGEALSESNAIRNAAEKKGEAKVDQGQTELVATFHKSYGS